MNKRFITNILLLLTTTGAFPAMTLAQDPQPAPAPTAAPTASADTAALKAQAVIDRGLAYLKTQQKPDFGWQNESDPPAITALVLKAFLQDSKYDAEVKFIDKGFEKLLSYQKEDGSISNDLLANYNTAIALSALAMAKEPEYQAPLDKALKFLRTLQWGDKISGLDHKWGDKSLAVPEGDVRYGGFGYGKKERPDGSNLQMTLDALHDAGVKPDDPAYKAALVFVARMQNRSESNTQPWAGNDGGFIYTPAAGGESFAGEYIGPDGKRLLRSYGSMTYAGLKSMIYAGLTKDDPRVQSAWEWIGHNFTFDENPGVKLGDGQSSESGLFYYYHTAARALRAYGEPVITDSAGNKHDWRVELVAKLSAIQKPDGSFVGNRKWMEANPVLCTALAVLAAQEAQQDLVKTSAAK